MTIREIKSDLIISNDEIARLITKTHRGNYHGLNASDKDDKNERAGSTVGTEECGTVLVGTTVFVLSPFLSYTILKYLVDRLFLSSIGVLKFK